MRHFADPDFWVAYDRLPRPVRDLADKNFALLKQDPKHPSLKLKKSAGFGLSALASITGPSR